MEGRVPAPSGCFMNLCDGTSPGKQSSIRTRASGGLLAFVPGTLLSAPAPTPHPTPQRADTAPFLQRSIQLPSENSRAHGAFGHGAPSRPAFPRAAREPWHLVPVPFHLSHSVRPRLTPVCFICAAASTLGIRSQMPGKINTGKHL